MAAYRKKDWNRFLNMIDDRESMFDTWDEWNHSFQKKKLDLIHQGFEIQEIVVNLDELLDYCRIEKLPNEGQTRARFVQTK